MAIDRRQWASYQRVWDANERLGVREGDVVWICGAEGCEFAVTDHDYFHGEDSKLEHDCPWSPPGGPTGFAPR